MLSSGVCLVLVITLVLTAVPEIGAQQEDQHLCKCVEDLKCPCQNQNLLSWTPLQMILLGPIDPNTSSAQVFPIPSTSVPFSASEVLIFFWFSSGDCLPSHQYVPIFTENETGVHYTKYFTIFAREQDANTLVTENMWFPIGKRNVYVKFSKAESCSSMAGELYVIGYR